MFLKVETGPRASGHLRDLPECSFWAPSNAWASGSLGTTELGTVSFLSSGDIHAKSLS